MSYVTGRKLSREWMDDPNADRDELAASLAYLRTINKRLGGVEAALGHFRRWSRDWSQRGHTTTGKPVRILDIGTGTADIPLAIADWSAAAGFKVHITAIDMHAITVELARQHVQESFRHPNNAPLSREGSALPPIAILQADALKLIDLFEPGSFDYVHAGLFLHHLNDVEVMTMLRIMDRLAVRGMIWNDLVRGWMSALGVRLMLMTTKPTAMVKHDAIVSVQAGFTKRDAKELAKRTGWTKVRYQRHRWHRFTLVCEKVTG